MTKGRMLLAALSSATLVSCAEPITPERALAPRSDEVVTSDKNAKHLLKNVDVSGTVEGGGTFVGRATITSFGYDQATNTLLASGVINGFVTVDGRKQHVRQVFTDDVSVDTTASGGTGGTYTVTCRPPSYSSVSVTSSPAIGSARAGSRGASGPPARPAASSFIIDLRFHT